METEVIIGIGLGVYVVLILIADANEIRRWNQSTDYRWWKIWEWKGMKRFSVDTVKNVKIVTWPKGKWYQSS